MAPRSSQGKAASLRRTTPDRY